MDTGPSAESGDGVPVWPQGVMVALALLARSRSECLSDRPPRHQALLQGNLRELSHGVH